MPLTAGELLGGIAGLRPRNAAHLRAFRRKVSKELASAPPASVLALALDLIASGDPYARFVAYELVQHHPSAPGRLTAAQIERLGQGISDWAAVDGFACYISGPAWRAGRIPDARVHRWARSKDKWWRRAALVSTVPLNVRSQGGTGDAHRTLAVCALLTGDREEMVVKALSWALRALAVREPAAADGFLEVHEDDLAALVKREVRNKLATGLKNPRKAG